MFQSVYPSGHPSTQPSAGELCPIRDIKEDISNVKFQQKIIAESLISW